MTAELPGGVRKPDGKRPEREGAPGVPKREEFVEKEISGMSGRGKIPEKCLTGKEQNRSEKRVAESHPLLL